VTEEANADAARLVEQLRAQADAEVERIKCKALSRFSFCVPSWFAQLRQDLGSESVRRASELVNEHVSDAGKQSATVDRFIDELDAMAPLRSGDL